jgi:Fe-S cluster assembly protein SufD
MTTLTELEPILTSGPEWLGRLRRQAYERFSALGFPSTKDEEWKYTNVSPIAKTQFVRAPLDGFRPRRQDLPDLGCAVRLVFVNGRFSPELSTLEPAGGLRVQSLAAALTEGHPAVEAHLGRYASFEKQAFVALNTALAEDGALVEIGKDAAPERPVHLVFWSSAGDAPVAVHSRILILAARGSQASVIEHYLGAPGSRYFTNAVTEAVLGPGAVLDHYRIQDESERAYHVAAFQAVQDRDSVLRSHNVAFGAALSRNDVNSVLDAEGAECVLNGLFLVNGERHADFHTLLDHAKPHCTSHELYKGILDGRGAGVFNGKIIVRKDAQKTNAIQSNRNLLLSSDAVINTKPQLEIFADDVRCTHGATVGQMDREALFYLRSRGIPAAAAREMLTLAFAGEVLDEMRWEPLKERLTAELHEILSRALEGTAA